MPVRRAAGPRRVSAIIDGDSTRLCRHPTGAASRGQVDMDLFAVAPCANPDFGRVNPGTASGSKEQQEKNTNAGGPCKTKSDDGRRSSRPRKQQTSSAPLVRPSTSRLNAVRYRAL